MDVSTINEAIILLVIGIASSAVVLIIIFYYKLKMRNIICCKRWPRIFSIVSAKRRYSSHFQDFWIALLQDTSGNNHHDYIESSEKKALGLWCRVCTCWVSTRRSTREGSCAPCSSKRISEVLRC